MRVWLDILTPKQVRFFKPVAEMLEGGGHEVLATSRHFREVEELAALEGFDLSFVGARGGKSLREQLDMSLKREQLLLPKIVDFGPDLSISVASADCARISFGLRIGHVAVNDSPHSLVAGMLSLPLSKHLLTPWIIPYSAWSVFGLKRSQITRYRALDPAAWLKRSGPKEEKPKGDRPTILVRLEESYAPYLIGADESWPGRVLETVARHFGKYNLVALCRYDDQLRGVKAKFGGTYSVPDKAVDGTNLIRGSDVFIGMGGTMTAEAALLGVPAISAFQGADLYTERYLVANKLLLRAESAGTLPRLITRALDPRYRDGCRKRARIVLNRMEDPAARVVSMALSLGQAKV